MKAETDARRGSSDGQGLTPSMASARAHEQDARSGRAEGWRRSAGARVRPADRVAFVRHLVTLLKAGLPLAKCLATLAQQFENPRLSAVISELGHEVASGEMLSSAMASRPKAFATLTVNVVRAGEVGGTLPETLEQLAEDMEKRQALRRAVVGAMVYPAVVIATATLVIGFVLIYVVPTFEDVYRKMRVELPLITQLLLWVSRTALAYWWAPVLAAGAVLAAWKPLMRAEGFRRRWDRLALRLPALGKVRRKALAARFLGTFATLMRSGVSIVESLRLMSDLADNLVVREALADIRRHVSRGGRMSEPMAQYAWLFSPMAIQMISLGEETGSLPEAAAHTAAFLADEVEANVKTLTTLLEPMLTVVLGVIVGAIALAVYLPMFDLMKHVSH